MPQEITSKLLRLLGMLSFFAMLSNSEVSVAAEINIAVASNFSVPMKHIISAFEMKSGHKVTTVIGSSGKLYTQIQQGAPFAVFLSADQSKPILLEKEGLTLHNSRFTYAVGTLVLWSNNDSITEVNERVLAENKFHRIAIANPKLAPYGIAAQQVMQHLGIEKAIEAKLVRGEDISQTYHFIRTQNADLGFVALSQLMDKNTKNVGRYWTVPKDYYRPIRQDAVVLKSASESVAVQDLMKFLRSQEAKAIISQFGYQTVD